MLSIKQIKKTIIMKNILPIIFATTVAICIVGCSRKAIMVSNLEQNKINSQRLEMDYPSSVVDAEASASTSDRFTFSSSATDHGFIAKQMAIKNEKAKTESMIAEIKKANTKAEKIEIFRRNMSEKIGVKKTEKMINKLSASKEQLSGGQLTTGIIVGVIGLVLIAIAGMTGGASGLVYLAGIILFVAGVILILIGIF